MPVTIDKKVNCRSEYLRTACALSIAGGFLDVYSYIYRGGVFANAITGNIALLGGNIAAGKFGNCGKYLLAICFYALGVLMTEMLFKFSSERLRRHCHQVVLLLEIFCIIPASFLPREYNYLVNSVIAFVCALQVQSFRICHGNAFASTMCTGNLRSGSEAMAHFILERSSAKLQQAYRYYIIIFFFLTGAAAGAWCLNTFGQMAILLVPTELATIAIFIENRLNIRETASK